MNKSLIFVCTIFIFSISCNSNSKHASPAIPNQSNSVVENAPLKALIIDGENNHGVWPKTTMMMKDYLEETGLFSVDIDRTAFTWQGPHYDKMEGIEDIKELLAKYPAPNESPKSVDEPKADPNYNPEFNKYDLVVSNFGWKASTWSEESKRAFEKYMIEGGGLVIVHAADNSWGDWDEYNKMIGVGAWGGRDEKTGPYVYYDDQDKLQHDPKAGQCGSHGAQYEYVLKTRAPQHPIMKGLPQEWKHTQDELYDRLRGPAENMTVLSTSYSDPVGNAPPWDKKVSGSGNHEPVMSAITYGKGRTFHTTMGHMDYSMECVGFITTLQRGAEWAATGKVTQAIPLDFPSADAISSRKWGK